MGCGNSRSGGGATVTRPESKKVHPKPPKNEPRIHVGNPLKKLFHIHDKDERHSELEEISRHALEEIKEIINNGEESLGLPKLDPYVSDAAFKKDFSFSKGEFSLSLDHPIITGLSTISLTNEPISISISDGTVRFSLGIERLKLESEDFVISGTYKLLFRERHLRKTGGLELEANGITVHITLQIKPWDDPPEVVDVGSHCEIDQLELDIEDSVVIDVLFPVFKSKFESLITQKLRQGLSMVMTNKLREMCKKQRWAVNRLHELYLMKKGQGFDEDGDGKDDLRILEGFGEVGELPLPLFWKLPSVDVDNTPHIPLKNLMEEAATGDVILFGGSFPSSQSIRRFTQSCFSHVGIVIKEHDLEGGKALYWHTAEDKYKPVLRNMVPSAGIQLNILDDIIMDYYYSDTKCTICWRKLNRPKRSTEEESNYWERLKTFILKMEGLPYSDDSKSLWVMGLLEIENPKENDIFCAGLAADSLMHLGLLETKFKPYQYAPRDFSELGSLLPFTNPASHYEDEVVIDVYK